MLQKFKNFIHCFLLSKVAVSDATEQVNYVTSINFTDGNDTSSEELKCRLKTLLNCPIVCLFACVQRQHNCQKKSIPYRQRWIKGTFAAGLLYIENCYGLRLWAVQGRGDCVVVEVYEVKLWMIGVCQDAVMLVRQSTLEWYVVCVNNWRACRKWPKSTNRNDT